MAAPTLPDLRKYLRYELDGGETDTTQDTALGIIFAGAQRWVENYTGHLLVQRPVKQTPAALGNYFDLRWRPYVPGSLALTVLDSAGAPDNSFDAFAVYEVDGVMRVKPTGDWPTTAGGFEFSYIAGYDDAYDLPEDLVLAVMLLAGMTDEERGDQSAQGWTSLYNLLEQYRLPTLA